MRDVAGLIGYLGLVLPGFKPMVNPKETYQRFTREYDITPSNMKKYWNRMVMEVCFDPYGKWAKRLCYKGYGINWGMLMKVHEAWSIIQQAEKDGISNIIPILVVMECDPKEAKDRLGKGLWKSLCKNSTERNILISKVVQSMNSVRADVDQEIKYQLLNCNLFPSTYLKYTPNCGHYIPRGGLSGGDIVDYLRFGKCTIHDMCKPRNNHIVLDTYRLARQLSRRVPKGLTLEEIRRLHDEFVGESRMIADKKSRVTFPYLPEGAKTEYSDDNGTARLLTTKEEVRLEGDAMHHYVGCYAQECFDGRYQVWHLSVDGEESTLGLSINTQEGVYSFMKHQHYTACNGDVSDMSNTFRQKLIHSLNTSLEPKLDECNIEYTEDIE